MKKVILALVLISVVACKKSEEKDSDSTSLGDVVNGAKTLNNLSSAMDDIQKQTDALKKLTPLSNDVLKSAVPESMLNLNRNEVSVGDTTMMGLASATAMYGENSGKNINITIMDGAGETGSAVISLLLMGLQAESEKTIPEGFEKVTKFNNHKAMLSQRQYENSEIESSIQYIINKRYSVKIEGHGYSLDELKPAMDAINSSALK